MFIPLVDMVGYVASAVGTGIMVPQIVKIVRSKNVGCLSLASLVMYFVTCLLWGTYGVMMRAAPIIVCNVIAGTVGLVQLALWFRYRKR